MLQNHVFVVWHLRTTSRMGPITDLQSWVEVKTFWTLLQPVTIIGAVAELGTVTRDSQMVVFYNGPDIGAKVITYST